MKLRIIHAPSEIAGQMGMLCDGLRTAGAHAVGYNWFQSYLRYRSPAVMQTDAYELALSLDTFIRIGDLFHFHNGNSFLTDNADIPFIHAAGKKMIMHHWGSDVRTSWRTKKLNRYGLPPGYMSDKDIHERLVRLSRHIQHAVVQDAELYPHVKDYYRHVHIVPVACEVRRFRPVYPVLGSRPLRIVHAPTRPAFKGSRYVEAAITSLKRQYPIDYISVQKKSHQEALRIYASADVIIDQLLCGSYGVLTVEAMAMGKPVIAYIREDVRRSQPAELPIIQADPQSIHAVLRGILQQPDRLQVIGRASRVYVERRHDTRVIIPQLQAIYNQI